MRLWRSGLRRLDRIAPDLNQEMDYKEELYREVCKARDEWRRACWAFEEAQGEEEVDVAIYLLEAAERRYQIQLKLAKQAKVDWDAFRKGAYF
nr:DUF2508 domain-containing protein [Paenibacillus faecis]